MRWLLVVVLACNACGSSRAVGAWAHESYCAPPVPSPALQLPSVAPLPAEAVDERLRRRYTRRSLLVAHAIGALPLLERLDDGVSDVNVARERILERVVETHMEVAAIVAELDCEGERTSQVSEHMRQRETLLARWLTVASITVGAAAAIVVAALQGADSAPSVQEGVGIGGGALSAGLGLTELFIHEKRTFPHARNLLHDIWKGPARSRVFPPALWFYLTEPEFSNTGVRSIRESIVQRWKRFREADEGANLLFGAGGVYKTDRLSTRANMLDQLKSSVDSMNQELAHFETELRLREGGADERPSR
jgi:hypothetical protein